METVFLFANSSNNYENENNESFAKKRVSSIFENVPKKIKHKHS